MSRFDIGNGVSHPEFGDGNVICESSQYPPDPKGSRYFVQFEKEKKSVYESELEPKPSLAKYRNFNRGKRAYENFQERKRNPR
jgi:hypothetical protein